MVIRIVPVMELVSLVKSIQIKKMNNSKSYNLSEKRSFSLSTFHGVSYIHLRDKVKQKSISLTNNEFGTLVKNKKKIQAKMNKLNVKQKSKKRKREENLSCDSDDSMKTDSDED